MIVPFFPWLKLYAQKKYYGKARGECPLEICPSKSQCRERCLLAEFCGKMQEAHSIPYDGLKREKS